MSDKKVNSAIPGFVVGTLIGAVIFPASLIGVVAVAVAGGAVSSMIEDKKDKD